MNEWFSCPQAPSQERETKLEDDFRNHGGEVWQNSDPTSYLYMHKEWWQDWVSTCGMFNTEMRKTIFLIHSASLKWKFAQTEQDFWFKSEALWIQRKGAAKCSPFQWWLEMGIEKMAPSFWPHPRKSGLPSQLGWWRICLQCRRPRFNSWVRKIPWRREWQPTSVFLPEEFHG